jgi:hypothetical protein
MSKQHPARPSDEGVAPSAEPASPGGHNTDGGSGPGNAGTGMGERTDSLGLIGTGGPETAGVPPTAATGRSGESAGGLAAGPANIGGGRPGPNRQHHTASPADTRLDDGARTDVEPTTLDVDRPTPGAGILDTMQGKPL